MEKAGASSVVAEGINDGLCLGGALSKSMLGVANAGAKLGSNVPSKIATHASSAIEQSQKLLTFQPKYIVGDITTGLIHTQFKHFSDSTIKNASTFLPGLNFRGLMQLTNEACSITKQWNIAKNGKHVTRVDMGRIIGLKNGQKPTQFLTVVIENGVHVTSYPN